MDGASFQHAPERRRVRVEEVDPSVPSDARIVGSAYRVEEPEDAMPLCTDVAEVIGAPGMGGDEQLAQDERQAKDDLVVLLNPNIESNMNEFLNSLP